jgi:starch-binding outer membrane protein, SusD/RagB family
MKNIAKLLGLVALGVTLPQAGCNDPLTVKTPDIVPPSALNDTSALATLRAGAIGDFSIAYTGDHPDGSGGTAEGVILYGGLLADEFIDSETFPTRIEVDARTIHLTNADIDLWYRLLHRARNSAEIAADAYRRLRPVDPGNPEVLDLAGFTYVFLAETFCSGVPVSHLNADGSITYGTPLTTVALLDTAIARFDSAISIATALPSGFSSVATEMIQLGTLGKARALLFRANRPGGQPGDLAAAAALAATIPTTFAYSQEHTTTTDRENNGVFNAGATDGRYSVADGEGVNGFSYRSNPDPRTTSQRDPGGVGFDGSTPLWDNLRYGSRTASITVATGVEARLIEAENSLATGDFAGFLSHLNEPRTNPSERSYFDPNPFDRTSPGTAAIGALPSLTAADTVSAGGSVNLLFAERARWLWLTAHRLGDLRRLMVQYGKTQNQVFPIGPYFKGQPPTYGVDVNLPVPVTEQNNPNFTACLDRLP